MLSEPLPTTIDARKAAVRGSRISGVLQPADLPRFRSLLAGDEGIIRVQLAFDSDDDRRAIVEVTIEAEVTVTCQRCLEPMSEPIHCESTLAIVQSDSQAKELPGHLDPLVVEGQFCDLRGIVEDELILTKPAFSYHDNAQCFDRKVTVSGGTPQDSKESGVDNPFAVLADLIPTTSHQEKK